MKNQDPHPSTNMVVVHCKTTGAVRRIIFSPKDTDFRHHKQHENEIMIYHNKEVSDLSLDNLNKLAQKKFLEHGLTHKLSFKTRCAVINKDNVVVHILNGSPYIDTVSDCILVLSDMAEVGDIATILERE
jgi:hypothetical protein